MNLILIWSVWLITILTFYLGFKWGKEENNYDGTPFGQKDIPG